VKIECPASTSSWTAIRNSTHTPRGSADLLSWCAKRLHEHEGYVIEDLEDLPDIKNWTLSRQPPTR
jgi:xylulose-5-phosphate/fructose-6-phosphate phosphoketolase